MTTGTATGLSLYELNREVAGHKATIITLSGQRFRGEIIRVRVGYTYFADESGDRRTLGTDRIHAIELKNRGRGLLQGLGLGLALGVGVGIVGAEDVESRLKEESGIEDLGKLVLVAATGAVGAVLGALVGTVRGSRKRYVINERLR